MLRTLYHGSENIIEKPVFGFGNIHNDYGLGFYCCTNLGLAKEWGARKSGKGFANKYTLRDDNLNILDLTKEPNNNIFTWIALLMKNRTLSKDLANEYPRELKYLEQYLIDVSQYDVVIGFRADDAYFKFPESFVKSELTIDSMKEIYTAGNLGKQYVLISEHAFNLIKFVEASEVNADSFKKYYERKGAADKIYSQYKNNDKYSSGLFLKDLVRDA